MRRIPKSAKVFAALMFVSICLTATPIVVLANRIHPTVFEMPFFLVWTIGGPLLAFVFSAIYTNIVNRNEEEPPQFSAEFDSGKG